MNQKAHLRIFGAIFLGIFTWSLSHATPAPKYTPAGTWEYSAPSAPEGYGMGKMVVTETEDGFGVTIVFNEYARIEAEKVEYRKKAINFVIYVEYEEVSISGIFNKDTFAGKVNSSMGVFDFSASRKKAE